MSFVLLTFYSQWTKHYRYIYHTTGFDPTYCSKTKYCMRQSVAQVTASCNEQNVVFNNGLLELQPAVMLQFCNITAGCYLNHWSLHTIFCLLSACWIKTNGMIYIPIMFCPLTVQKNTDNIHTHYLLAGELGFGSSSKDWMEVKIAPTS